MYRCMLLLIYKTPTDSLIKIYISIERPRGEKIERTTTGPLKKIVNLLYLFNAENE